jgi:signal peptidase I
VAADPTTAGRGREVMRGLIEIPIVAALAIVIVVVLRAFVVQPFYIPSASMEPQLQVNDKILVSRLSYRLHPIHRGDLIVFDEPPGARLEGIAPSSTGAVKWVGERLGLVPRTDELVKRVIGLPGDRVEGHDGHVYVDAHLLIEPYLPVGRQTEDFAPEIVPKGMLWVMGDNRGNSNDSRYFGPIRKSTVVGRAVLKVWPLDKFSFL